MSEINNTQNLNAHYSNNSKVVRPKKVVVEAPNSIPENHLFNDISANKKMENICNDIYVETKKEVNRPENNFIKYFAGGTAAILGFLGLRKLFK